MPRDVIIRCVSVKRKLEEHPYFKLRTKTGKPFKNREKKLAALKSKGIETWIDFEMCKEGKMKQ